MRKLIKVTKSDIKNSTGVFYDDVNGGCETCPIALALRRQGFDNAVVLGDGSWGQGDYMDVLGHSKPLSRSCKRFINNYDNGKKVKPFNFLVEV